MYISVERNSAQVEDGSGRTHDVTRHPCVAELFSEYPITGKKEKPLKFIMIGKRRLEKNS